MKQSKPFLTVVVLFCCAFLLSGCGQLPCCGADVTLRILTYNTHHAKGVNGKLDLARIADVIRNSGADVVALNEVDKNWDRSGNVDQTQKLAEILDMHSVFAPTVGDNYGNAVLSRYPILSSTVHPLTPGAEPRVCIESRIDVEGVLITFMAVHLDSQTNRAAEVLDIVKIIRGKPPEEKIVLAGDFNLEPAAAELRPLLEYVDDARIAAGGNLTATMVDSNIWIDYVFVSPNLKSAVRICRSLRTPTTAVASDHYPVYAELVLEK